MAGSVKINGELIQSSSQISAMSGYVQQDDIFIGTLKVKEHLYFQVNLCSNMIYVFREICLYLMNFKLGYVKNGRFFDTGWKRNES